jgi:hypothetical protein
VHACVVERTNTVAIFSLGSDATVEATSVRDVDVRAPDGVHGEGIQAADRNGERASLVVRASIIERAHSVGLSVVGADATIESVIVRDTQPRTDQRFGDGIGIEPHVASSQGSTVTIHATVVDGSFDSGIYVIASSAEIAGVAVRGTKASPASGLFGDGISVLSQGGPASATVSASLITGSSRAGLSSFGAELTLASTTLDCNEIQLDGETYGDAAKYEDHGGNTCGCKGASTVCQVLSGGLAPPDPLASGP